jgi:hypothetical protein
MMLLVSGETIDVAEAERLFIIGLADKVVTPADRLR